MNKIAIGTANFGQNYGINNKVGELSVKTIRDIIETASSIGCRFIDTAYLYGTAEEKLGTIDSSVRENFNFISKYPGEEIGSVNGVFQKSLEHLETDKLYGYLFHNFNTYIKRPELLNAFQVLKDSGKIEKIGFSLYHPSELDTLFERDISFDLVQLPFNIIDRRFTEYFAKLGELGVEVHIRSIYMQGLIYRNPDELSGNLQAFKSTLISLKEIAKSVGLTIQQLAVNFVLQNEEIQKVVVGVDNKEQLLDLNEMVESFSEDLSNIELPLIAKEHEYLLIPSNWRTK